MKYCINIYVMLIAFYNGLPDVKELCVEDI